MSKSVWECFTHEFEGFGRIVTFSRLSSTLTSLTLLTRFTTTSFGDHLRQRQTSASDQHLKIYRKHVTPQSQNKTSATCQAQHQRGRSQRPPTENLVFDQMPQQNNGDLIEFNGQPIGFDGSTCSVWSHWPSLLCLHRTRPTGPCRGPAQPRQF